MNLSRALDYSIKDSSEEESDSDSDASDAVVPDSNLREILNQNLRKSNLTIEYFGLPSNR